MLEAYQLRKRFNNDAEYDAWCRANPRGPRLIHHSKQNGYIHQWIDATNAPHPNADSELLVKLQNAI